MEFSVYAAWHHVDAIPTDAVERINREFRPADDSLCVWVDEHNDRVLVISLDLVVNDEDAALNAGSALIAEAAAIGELAGRPGDVTAMTEEGQWRRQGAV